MLAREQIETRTNSAHLLYIEKAISLLDIMRESSVARNIGSLAKEMVKSLLHVGADGTEENDELDPLKQLHEMMGAGTGLNVDFDAFGFLDSFPLAFGLQADSDMNMPL